MNCRGVRWEEECSQEVGPVAAHRMSGIAGAGMADRYTEKQEMQRRSLAGDSVVVMGTGLRARAWASAGVWRAGGTGRGGSST